MHIPFYKNIYRNSNQEINLKIKSFTLDTISNPPNPQRDYRLFVFIVFRPYPNTYWSHIATTFANIPRGFVSEYTIPKNTRKITSSERSRKLQILRLIAFQGFLRQVSFIVLGQRVLEISTISRLLDRSPDAYDTQLCRRYTRMGTDTFRG